MLSLSGIHPAKRGTVRFLCLFILGAKPLYRKEEKI